jgi:hypothetical protein
VSTTGTLQTLCAVILDERKSLTSTLYRILGELAYLLIGRSWIAYLLIGRSWIAYLMMGGSWGGGDASDLTLLYGVNNLDYALVRDFTGIPVWYTLQWSVEALPLPELIRPNCGKFQVDPAAVVPDGAITTPVEAQDTLIALVLSRGNR